jgi:hypothetical protein
MGMSGMSTYYSLGGCPETGGILFIENMMIDHCILDKATITMDEIIISLPSWESPKNRWIAR